VPIGGAYRASPLALGMDGDWVPAASGKTSWSRDHGKVHGRR
jgi:hypothetical protein